MIGERRGWWSTHVLACHGKGSRIFVLSPDLIPRLEILRSPAMVLESIPSSFPLIRSFDFLALSFKFSLLTPWVGNTFRTVQKKTRERLKNHGSLIQKIEAGMRI